MTPQQRAAVRALTDQLPDGPPSCDRRWLLLEVPALEWERHPDASSLGAWLEAWGVPVSRARIRGLRTGPHPLRRGWVLLVLACPAFRRVPTGTAAPIVGLLDARLRPPHLTQGTSAS